jgi:pimeloyl-ACP methyl ester carboxylesterase
MGARVTPYTYIYALALLAWSSTVTASDLAKEQRWAEQIVDALLVGEAVWLEDGTQKFLGLYTENTTAKSRGGVIVLHGIGVHPDWPDVVYPLRSQLPDYGWTTLSIQMPILANDADINDYQKIWDEVPGRINAAIAYLQKRNIGNIVVIGHSLGAAMASYYLANNPKQNLTAFVGIGMTEITVDPRMNNANSLRQITIPVFDVYGANDLGEVTNSVKARRTAANKAGNKTFTQLEVAGADHFFTGMDDTLVTRVKSWLVKHATDN